jgi:hypothetical protein
MLVRKTIFGGIESVGGNIVTSFTGGTRYDIIASGRLQAGEDLHVTGLSTLVGDLELSTGTSEMTMHNGIFRVSLVGATTLFRLTDTDGMDINNSVKLTAGDLTVEEGVLYVKNDGSLASIAVFRTLYPGAGYIEIQSRVANDGQIRFYDNVTYRWSIGLDLSPLAFAITNIEGIFDAATDLLRLTASGFTLLSLAGSGQRQVTVNASGLLSTNVAPGVTETYTDVSSVSVGRTVAYNIPLCDYFLIDVSVDVEDSDTDYDFNLINFETAGVSRLLYIDMRLSGEGRTTFDVQVKVRAGTLGTLLLNETVTNPEADKYWTLSLFYNGDTGYWSTLIDAATVRTT